MAQSSSKARFRLPTWGTLVMGVATLFGGEARAKVADLDRLKDEVLIRTEGYQIYVSERGAPFRELVLDDTPEARHLRKLLLEAGAENGPIAVPIGPLIVANGGAGPDGTSPAGLNKK